MSQHARAHSLDAMVQYNNSGFHRHRLHDVSTDGAFVEMGNVRVLRRDSTLRIVFVHHEAGRNETHLIEARVMDVANDGAKLAFCELDPPAQQALRKLQTD